MNIKIMNITEQEFINQMKYVIEAVVNPYIEAEVKRQLLQVKADMQKEWVDNLGYEVRSASGLTTLEEEVANRLEVSIRPKR